MGDVVWIAILENSHCTQGCSVVDYVLCKPTFFKHVNTFEVLDPNIISDHCVITFSINALVDDENAIVVDNNENFVPYIYINGIPIRKMHIFMLSQMKTFLENLMN